MILHIRIVFVVCGLFSLYTLPAQLRSGKELTQKVNSIVSDIEHLSDSLIGTDFRLINGEEYSFRHFGINGHPYFRTNSWSEGAVTIDNIEFKGLELRYDIYDDVLVLNYLSSRESFMISLNRDVVHEFSLENDHFIQLGVKDGFQERGYYQDLYNGKIQFLVKWNKYISGSTELGPGEFKENPVKLIKKDSVYYSFSGKRSLLNILSDQKDLIRKYIKTKAIDVKYGSDMELVGIFCYYDTLIMAD